VVVHNPGNAIAEFHVLPLGDQGGCAASVPLAAALAPGETRRLADVSQPGSGIGACGALRVASTARLSVLWAPCHSAGGVRSTVADLAPLRAAVPSSLAVGIGERTDIAFTPVAGPGARAALECQVVLVEVDGRPLAVRITPRDGAGTPVAAPRDLRVAPHSLVPVRCGEVFPVITSPIVRLTVAPVAGSGRVLCLTEFPLPAGIPPPGETGEGTAAQRRQSNAGKRPGTDAGGVIAPRDP
jgi:hypothetical protein